MTIKRHERTHARWCAVQALYAAEVTGKKPHEVIDGGACLFTGDVFEELTQAVNEAEADWMPRYEAWQQQLQDGVEGAQAPAFADIDMSVYASVSPMPEYALALVQGVEETCKELDFHLGSVSSNWSVDRMPIADRCILRIAAFEMLHVEETPVSVAINEAVDLAKLFGGQNESSQFVNGVLGNIARSLEAGELPEMPAERPAAELPTDSPLMTAFDDADADQSQQADQAEAEHAE